MMTPEEYLGRVRSIAWVAAEYVPQELMTEVLSLIDNGEPADGLCSLAWVIVRNRIHVPAEVIAGIRTYTAELVSDEFMPPDLDDYAMDKDT